MSWLNYHHLHYFWLVVREDGIVPAAKKLRVSHPTVSTQVKRLEEALDEQLFDLPDLGQLEPPSAAVDVSSRPASSKVREVTKPSGDVRDV